MPSLENAACPAKSLLALLKLDREKPVKMVEFTQIVGEYPHVAKRIREDLEALGLLDVKRVERPGSAEQLEIRLTPLGEKVRGHVRGIEADMRAAGP